MLDKFANLLYRAKSRKSLNIKGLRRAARPKSLVIKDLVT